VKSQGRRIKTLVVDDTAFMRKALVDILSMDEEVEVVGVARHGKEALQAIEILKPDVVTLDVDMPVMDGLTAIKHIMIRSPRPVIMVSGLAGQGTVTLEALRLGAIDFFPKPSGTISLDIHEQADELNNIVKQAAQINPWALQRARLPLANKQPRHTSDNPMGILMIGAHRGTCTSLIRLLGNINPQLPLTIIAVQDISCQVLDSYAQELNKVIPWHVSVNRHKSKLYPGHCILASYGQPWSIRKNSSGHLELIAEKQGSLDDLFAQTALILGNRSLGVILGGTSREGIKGLKTLREKGGTSLVLAPQACIYKDAAETALREQAAKAVASEKELWSRIEAFGRQLVLKAACNQA